MNAYLCMLNPLHGIQSSVAHWLRIFFHSSFHSTKNLHASSFVICQSAYTPAISLKPFCCSCAWSSGSNMSSGKIFESRRTSIMEHTCSGVSIPFANAAATSQKNFCSFCCRSSCLFMKSFMKEACSVIVVVSYAGVTAFRLSVRISFQFFFSSYGTSGKRFIM